MNLNVFWKLTKENITIPEFNFGETEKTSSIFYHSMKPDADVTYQTVNLFSSDKCFIYFISDLLHYIR